MLLSPLDEFARKFGEAQISPEDVKEEIKKATARKKIDYIITGEGHLLNPR